jgi:hypothetical protein
VRGFVVILASGHNRRRATESGALMNRAFTVRGGSWLVALGGGPCRMRWGCCGRAAAWND